MHHTMTLFLSFGDEQTNTWTPSIELPLKSAAERYRDVPDYPPAALSYDDSLGLHQEPVTLPSGEELHVTVAFVPANHGYTIAVFLEGRTLLSVSGFKSENEHAFDPTVVVRSPGGTYVTLMIGMRQQG